MPLTAFSNRFEKELDVKQLLDHLAKLDGLKRTPSIKDMPDSWRAFVKTDIECPSCFCRGAELVSDAHDQANGRAIRQASFRFTKTETSSGHHPTCDFFGQKDAQQAEGGVAFGSPKNAISKAVRELVCRGIALDIFNQRSIRDMRFWFFERKQVQEFDVTLHPKAAQWVRDVWRHSLGHKFDFTPDQAVLQIPGFDMKAAAESIVCTRHQDLLESLRSRRRWLGGIPAERIEKLVTLYQGKRAFNPTTLLQEYEATKSLTSFISHHYAPVSSHCRYGNLPNDKGESALFAFAALLLFCRGWDIQRAIEAFSLIASDKSPLNESLGNVIGLNPFHDYAAWDWLEFLQSCAPYDTVTFDFKAEVADVLAMFKALVPSDEANAAENAPKPLYVPEDPWATD